MSDFGDEFGEQFILVYRQTLQWATQQVGHITWSAGRGVARWALGKVRAERERESAADEVSRALAQAGEPGTVPEQGWAELSGVPGARVSRGQGGKVVVRFDLSDNEVGPGGEGISDFAAVAADMRAHLDSDGFAGGYDLDVDGDGIGTVVADEPLLGPIAASMGRYATACADRADKGSRVAGVDLADLAARAREEPSEGYRVYEPPRAGMVELAAAEAGPGGAPVALDERVDGRTAPHFGSSPADPGLAEALSEDLSARAAAELTSELRARGVEAEVVADGRGCRLLVADGQQDSAREALRHMSAQSREGDRARKAAQSSRSAGKRESVADRISRVAGGCSAQATPAAARVSAMRASGKFADTWSKAARKGR